MSTKSVVASHEQTGRQWWRHVVVIIAIAIAIFPPLFLN